MRTAYGPPERRGAGRAIAHGPRTARLRALHPLRRHPRRPLRLGSPGRPAAWRARPLARHHCNVEEQLLASRWQRAPPPARGHAQGLPRAARRAAADAPQRCLAAGAAARRAGGASRRARRSGRAVAHLGAFRALQHLAGVVQREPRQRPAIDGDQRIVRRDARALRGAARRGRDHLRGRAGEGDGALLRVTGASLFTPTDPPGRGVACAARYAQLTVEAGFCARAARRTARCGGTAGGQTPPQPSRAAHVRRDCRRPEAPSLRSGGQAARARAAAPSSAAAAMRELGGACAQAGSGAVRQAGAPRAGRSARRPPTRTRRRMSCRMQVRAPQPRPEEPMLAFLQGCCSGPCPGPPTSGQGRRETGGRRRRHG